SDPWGFASRARPEPVEGPEIPHPTPPEFRLAAPLAGRARLAMKDESLYKISAPMGNSAEISRQRYAALVPGLIPDAVEFGTALYAITKTTGF
ncbi:MAG: hypothetical protein ABSH08_21385, partial [Tepidisphaeraceae bacterium]